MNTELVLLGNHLAIKNSGISVADWPLSDPTNLVHKYTSDYQYHAIYDKTSYHVDIYMGVEHLIAFRRDSYYQDMFLVEFIEYNGIWHLVINRKYNHINVYSLPDCNLVREMELVCSEFLGDVFPLNVPGFSNRYYMAFGWLWGPIDNPYIIDLYEVVRTGTIGKIPLMGWKYIYELLEHGVSHHIIVDNIMFAGFISDIPQFKFCEEKIKAIDSDTDSIS